MTVRLYPFPHLLHPGPQFLGGRASFYAWFALPVGFPVKLEPQEIKPPIVRPAIGKKRLQQPPPSSLRQGVLGFLQFRGMPSHLADANDLRLPVQPRRKTGFVLASALPTLGPAGLAFFGTRRPQRGNNLPEVQTRRI